MHITKRLLLLFLVLAIVAAPLCSCGLFEGFATSQTQKGSAIEIDGPEQISIQEGRKVQLSLKSPEQIKGEVTWSASNIRVTVDKNGLVSAKYAGEVVVTARCGEYEDSVQITVIRKTISTTPDTPDMYAGVSAEEFYANYQPAQSADEAYWRSEHGFMSGSLTVPDQAPTVAQNRPMQGGKYIRNSVTPFIGDDVYVLVDVNGNEVMKIYRGGAYITLEEVAAYVYAFGNVPANYVKDKETEPYESMWGEYLRLNNTKFSGNTKKYPYEPVLPNISGCGGDLTYYEIDIGTTGTDCDPSFPVRIYNNGSSITRGAARIVYARYDKNNDSIIDPNERYLFYTYNHYNDFQEYLNYYGGWGELFGNITGGGKISSETHYNPTPYVEVVRAPLPGLALIYEETDAVEIVYFFCPIIDTRLRAA